MLKRFMQAGGWMAWCAITLVIAGLGAAGFEARQTLVVMSARNTVRDAGEHDFALRNRARHAVSATDDSVRIARRSGVANMTQPYVIVSLADNRLWVREGGAELFTTRVASGSGRTLEAAGSKEKYKFDTPRGKQIGRAHV